MRVSPISFKLQALRSLGLLGGSAVTLFRPLTAPPLENRFVVRLGVKKSPLGYQEPPYCFLCVVLNQA